MHLLAFGTAKFRGIQNSLAAGIVVSRWLNRVEETVCLDPFSMIVSSSFLMVACFPQLHVSSSCRLIIQWQSQLFFLESSSRSTSVLYPSSKPSLCPGGDGINWSRQAYIHLSALHWLCGWRPGKEWVLNRVMIIHLWEPEEVDDRQTKPTRFLHFKNNWNLSPGSA